MESESIVYVYTIKQELEAYKLDDNNNLEEEDEINPYHEIIANKVEKDNKDILQMEQWSILSNIVNYVQYDRHPRNFYDLGIKTVDQRSNKKIYSKGKERQIIEVDFDDTPETLRGDYLEMYKGNQLEVISTTRFDKNSNLSTAYLGKINITRASKIQVEEKFPILEQGYTIGKLLDGTDCQILLQTGARKSFISKSH